MHARSLIAAAAALALSGAAGAESPKRALAQPALVRPAAVQLASADKIARPAPVSAAEPAKRPRAMRITTCRCGEPQPRPEPQR